MRGKFIRRFDSALDKAEFEKENIFDNVRNATAILYVIIGFEVLMLLRLFLTKTPPYPRYVLQYMTSYIFLLVISFGILFCVFYTKHSKKDHLRLMDAATSLYAISFGLWAVAIAILDSHESAQFIVYLTVMVCIPSLLKLRPWLFILLELGGEVLLITGMMVFRDNHDLSQAVNLTVFTAIFVLISITKYNSSVDEFYNRKKINHLNDLLEKEKNLFETEAKTDHLTGLYSRNILKDDMIKQMSDDFAGQIPVGIAMFDLDDFKAVNDNYGHAVGDECLIKCGEIFREQPALTVYRYGGEEFLAVCDSITEDAFKEIIGNILSNVIALELSVGRLNLTVSAGYVFEVPADKFCDEKMIKAADRALYKAKTSGKNRYVKGSV